MGRAAGVPGRRRRPARRGGRLHAVPRRRPGLGHGQPRRRGGRVHARRAAPPASSTRSAGAPPGWRRVARRRPGTTAGGHPRWRGGRRPDGAGADRALRRGTDRRRADRAAPVRRRPLGAGRPVRAARRAGAGRTRPARSWPTTCSPSGCSPATSPPGGCWSTGSTGRWSPPAASLLETASAYLDGGGALEATARVLFVHPNTVRYRLGRIADGDRLRPDRPARGLHRADRPRAGPAGPADARVAAPAPATAASTSCPRHRPTCRNPPYRGPDCSCRSVTTGHGRTGKAGAVLVIVCPGQGSQTPGFLAPWLELPGFARPLGWLSAVAGLDLVAHGTDLRRRHDQGHRGRPAADRGAPAWSACCALFDQPGATGPRRRGRRRRRALGRRDHRRRGGRRAERRAGDGLRPRARPGDGRGQRRHADRHERRPRRRPRRGLAAPRSGTA